MGNTLNDNQVYEEGSQSVFFTPGAGSPDPNSPSSDPKNDLNDAKFQPTKEVESLVEYPSDTYLTSEQSAGGAGINQAQNATIYDSPAKTESIESVGNQEKKEIAPDNYLASRQNEAIAYQSQEQTPIPNDFNREAQTKPAPQARKGEIDDSTAISLVQRAEKEAEIFKASGNGDAAKYYAECQKLREEAA